MSDLAHAYFWPSGRLFNIRAIEAYAWEPRHCQLLALRNACLKYGLYLENAGE